MATGLREAFRSREVNKLYYYTPIQNIRSILENGIFSRNLVRSLKVRHIDFSLDSSQRRRSYTRVGNRPLHDYVPLFMVAASPMFEERLRQLGNQLACIMVSTSVCEQDGVFFSNGNAAHSELGTKFYFSPQDVKHLPWLDIKAHYGNSRIRGAEVLVPDKVEPRHFLYVMVTDPANPQVKVFLPERPTGVKYRRFDSGTVFENNTWSERLRKLVEQVSRNE